MSMKKVLFLFLLASVMSACSNAPVKFPEEKGTACMQRIQMPGSKPDQIECYPARVYLDPTRFHHLNQYQQDNLPPIPDLP